MFLDEPETCSYHPKGSPRGTKFMLSAEGKLRRVYIANSLASHFSQRPNVPNNKEWQVINHDTTSIIKLNSEYN